MLNLLMYRCMGTKNFQVVIKSYLEQLAELDAEFAEKYRVKENQIEQCCAYIISEMHNLAQNNVIGVTDDEVYGLAIHYYLEDDLEVNIQSYNQVLIMSNQFVELSEEEKAEARKEAFKQYQAEELRKLRNRQTKTIEKKKAQIQPSLFDF